MFRRTPAAVSLARRRLSTPAAGTVPRWRRVLIWSLLGAGFVGASIPLSSYAFLYYVEHSRNMMAPYLEIDKDVLRWEWNYEQEIWNAEPGGYGIDSGLGTTGKSHLRSAFVALRFGNATLANPTGQKGEFEIEHRSLQSAARSLWLALDEAESCKDRLHPGTLLEMRCLYASVLERLGPRSYADSRSAYSAALFQHPLQDKGIKSAQLLLKLGRLSSLLGDREEAEGFLIRCINICVGAPISGAISQTLKIERLPESAALQRVMSLALVNLSSILASTGQLKVAKEAQEKSIDVLGARRWPDKVSDATAPEALHSLFMQLQMSILSVHLAEVLYSESDSVQKSISCLASAARGSSQVFQALTGIKPPDSHSRFSPKDAHLLPSFSKSRLLQKPSDSLRRDSARTAAEGWNLMGVLLERTGKRLAAKNAFEQSVWWAGQKDAGDWITDQDYNTIKANYDRLRRDIDNERLLELS